MDVLPQASLFLGIIPALLILYICLKGYEDYYKDKTIFITFIAGIILGFIAAFVQFYFFGLVIISLISLSIFNQLFKTIILNLGRFQRKKETPIYGLSLGLGFGSSFTPFMLIAASASTYIPNNIYILSLIALGSLGIIFFHAGTGAYIGYGVYTGNLYKKLILSIVLELPLDFLTMLTINSDISNITTQIIFVFITIFYGFVVFFHIIKNVLPLIKKK